MAPGPLERQQKTKLAPIMDVEGMYSCKGVDAGNKGYSGVAIITKKGDIYIVNWMIIGSGGNFTGIGIRRGDDFVVGWALPVQSGIVRGVNIYKIEEGPRLVGRWASIPGPAVVQSETLTFLKPLEEEEK